VRREKMKKLLICAITLVDTISQVSFAEPGK
jgi:hypothetical protein